MVHLYYCTQNSNLGPPSARRVCYQCIVNWQLHHVNNQSRDKKCLFASEISKKLVIHLNCCCRTKQVSTNSSNLTVKSPLQKQFSKSGKINCRLSIKTKQNSPFSTYSCYRPCNGLQCSLFIAPPFINAYSTVIWTKVKFRYSSYRSTQICLIIFPISNHHSTFQLGVWWKAELNA